MRKTCQCLAFSCINKNIFYFRKRKIAELKEKNDKLKEEKQKKKEGKQKASDSKTETGGENGKKEDDKGESLT